MSARPLYETSNDRAGEECVRARLESAWRLKLHKLPICYSVDYAATRGAHIVAFVEVKRRAHKMMDFPTYLLSLGKLMRGRELCRHSGAYFVLVVEFLDRLAFWIDDGEPVAAEIAGRRDRGDSQDIEPCVMIPKGQFKIAELREPR